MHQQEHCALTVVKSMWVRSCKIKFQLPAARPGWFERRRQSTPCMQGIGMSKAMNVLTAVSFPSLLVALCYSCDSRVRPSRSKRWLAAG